MWVRQRTKRINQEILHFVEHIVVLELDHCCWSGGSWRNVRVHVFMKPVFCSVKVSIQIYQLGFLCYLSAIEKV